MYHLLFDPYNTTDTVTLTTLHPPSEIEIFRPQKLKFQKEVSGANCPFHLIQCSTPRPDVAVLQPNETLRFKTWFICCSYGLDALSPFWTSGTPTHLGPPELVHGWGQFHPQHNWQQSSLCLALMLSCSTLQLLVVILVQCTVYHWV